jgi:WD40 repeat protein
MPVGFIALHFHFKGAKLHPPVMTRLKLWEIEAGNHLQALPGHHGGATCVAFSPLESKLPLVVETAKYSYGTQEVVGGRSHELSGHSQPVMSSTHQKGFTLHPPVTSDDRTVRLWHARTRASRYILTGHGHGVLCVAFSPACFRRHG